MIRDITIGQYYASDSVIHRLDPRVKIMVTLFYIISLFLFDDFMGYAVAVGFFFLAVGLSKVPFSYIVKSHRAFLVNLCAVSKVSGNSQGYRLFLYDCEDSIPVSRAYSKEVKMLIEKMNNR